MNEIQRREVEETLSEIEKIETQIENLSKYRKHLEDIAEKYALKRSPFLAAIAGAIFGGSAGIGIGSMLGLIIVSGPAGALLGASLSVLLWRGRGYQRIERATEKLRLSLEEIRKQVEILPKNAPPEILEKLWKAYGEVIQRYNEIAVESLGDQASQFDKISAEANQQ